VPPAYRPHRIVVVGYGMAGSRLVEEVRRHDPEHRLSVTVLGAEKHAAYNRVLLSDVLAGSTDAEAIALTEPGWAAEADVELRLGTAATAIDRDRREVVCDDGTSVGYDTLVLATGSRAWVPPAEGLIDHTGELRPGVTVFRTVEDCQAIATAARAARRAVVLGGGLLGLEAARALAGRGLDVIVVHFAGHLMERQLDPCAGAVLRRTVEELGVQVRTDTTVTAVSGSDEVMSVRLTDGSTVDSELLVISCGVRPEVSLAEAAGLAVDRGIVVDDTLRSVTDERIYAIGECAEHDGEVYGLVAPAWDQARVAAERITCVDPDAAYTGSRVVTRLRVAGVDLAAMGESVQPADSADLSAEVIQFSDPARGTYKKVVIRDGRITGAILLGHIDTVGVVTQLFDRGAPAPQDRLSLLFAARSAGPSAQIPALMPDRATVCYCNGVTKEMITACVRGGARTVEDVSAATRTTTGCGSCRDSVDDLVGWLIRT
jgi:assimilatory nitrate reductase electron transfer subunit